MKSNWLPVVMFVLFLIIAAFPVLVVRGVSEVTPKIIEQGGAFHLVTKYCKFLPLPAKYQIVYEGELIHPSPEDYSSNANWGCDTSNFHFQIPDNLPEGKYSIRMILSYPPILRPFEIKSDEFVVVEGKTTRQSLNDIINILESWSEIK